MERIETHTDRQANINVKRNQKEAYMCSEHLYNVQVWQRSATEKNKIESFWHGFLHKIVTNGFKRKNVSKEYLNARKKAKSKKTKQDTPVPNDVDWAFLFNNKQL